MNFSKTYRLLIWTISAFLVAPIVVVVLASFDGSGQFRLALSHLSLRWYVAFLQSDLFVHAFLLSTGVALATAVLACAIGTDPAPFVSSLIARVCSGCGPSWTGLQTRWG